MSIIYAMSDIHGCLYEFDQTLSLIDLSGDSKLVLCGDYVHGPDSFGVLDKIMELQYEYGSDKVIALLGNHEDMVMDGRWPISGRDDEEYEDYEAKEERYLQWMQNLPRFYAEGNTIFVHAGIDEDLGEMWEYTDDFTFTEKFPPQTGSFSLGMNIVAGHVGTAEISGDPRFHDIYFDGENHYYIDGTVLESGIIPVLKVDTEKDKYYRVTESGAWIVLPYDEEYA